MGTRLAEVPVCVKPTLSGLLSDLDLDNVVRDYTSIPVNFSIAGSLLDLCTMGIYEATSYMFIWRLDRLAKVLFLVTRPAWVSFKCSIKGV